MQGCNIGRVGSDRVSTPADAVRFEEQAVPLSSLVDNNRPWMVALTTPLNRIDLLEHRLGNLTRSTGSGRDHNVPTLVSHPLDGGYDGGCSSTEHLQKRTTVRVTDELGHVHLSLDYAQLLGQAWNTGASVCVGAGQGQDRVSCDTGQNHAVEGRCDEFGDCED